MGGSRRVNVSPRVAGRIATDFPGARGGQVAEILSALDLGRGTPDGDERLCAAILVLANGDTDRLLDAAAGAETDWRDVLVAAGMADDDWRERVDEALGPRSAGS